ncbi:hypothetical protein DD237_004863 [Peronospora effusa]|uniref:Protein-S-isoprenylcysteine O-methyltransferase n=1 Tax=Peronospora effusa TaxID=542832 RepID=A0A425CIM5_9STRA|nr:hypothetical protein DD237_004863 [Peronospora effusa]
MFKSEAFRSDRGLGKVALAAFGLGVFMTLHVSLLIYTKCVALMDPSFDAIASSRWQCLEQWSWYALALGFFHLMEFMMTAAYRPTNVSYDANSTGRYVANTSFVVIAAFLLNHSREYHLAVLLSCVEFWLEFYFVPMWKLHSFVRPVGMAFVIGGQSFRVAAMSTAANNFSHRIEYFKRKEHRLVTHGVYRFIRHPSYLGWFWWIVGSQILLANPVCALGYTLVAWSFFHDRIPYEEQLLLGFFPNEYPAYKARTFSGIPFV